MKRHLALFLGMIALAFGSGCRNVQPWQRATLADESMQAERAGLNAALNEHVWFSREAASGGRGVAANGCGCN
jgi:hypothetical protein